MQLEVYQTDAEAFEAAAEAAAGHLRSTPERAVPTIGLPGARSGRGLLTALAAQGAPSWDKIAFVLTDEHCLPPSDPRANRVVATESLFAPRGIAPQRLAAPPLDTDDPATVWAGELVARLGPEPVLDVVLLVLGDDGHVAGLMPGSSALAAGGLVARVPVAEVTSEPRVARLTLTPALLRRARHTIVTAVGEGCANALAAALREPVETSRRPAQLFLPGGAVTWFVDRAAAGMLLRDARPAGAAQ